MKRVLSVFLLGLSVVLTTASGALADPPRRRASSAERERRSHHGSAAQRASDGRRRRGRFQRTLDRTEVHGRPVQIRRVTAAVAFEAPPPAAPAPRPYDHVLIVSLDGLRPDAIALTDAPNLTRLREVGTDATEARTITHSYTLPSHTSMLSGVDTNVHGLLHNNFTPRFGFSRAAPIFYYAHDAGLATAMFVSKPKLRHIAIPGSVDVFTRPDYVCTRVVSAAAEYLRTAPAGVTFVHLSEPDEFGHSRGWMTEAYLRGIASVDRCVGTLLTAIASRPDRDRVLMIFTSDHGGHGRSHGSQQEVDMRIPWIAWGSRAVRGAYAGPVSTMDTAATALAALGVPVPEGMVGRPVRAVLDGPVPSETPANSPANGAPSSTGAPAP